MPSVPCAAQARRPQSSSAWWTGAGGGSPVVVLLARQDLGGAGIDVELPAAPLRVARFHLVELVALALDFGEVAVAFPGQPLDQLRDGQGGAGRSGRRGGRRRGSGGGGGGL